MSGIYIGGMQLPSAEAITITIHPDGDVVKLNRHDDDVNIGKAIRVPDHGRCVDADELEKYYDAPRGEVLSEWSTIRRSQIDYATTILPSEYEEDEENDEEENICVSTIS